MSGITESWGRVGIAALASLLGSMMIYVDTIWNRFSSKPFSILKSSKFFGIALSISCGTLALTALNALLPECLQYMIDGKPSLTKKQANILVVLFFACGVLLCQFMNWLVLKFASKSVVSCSHDLDNAVRPHKHNTISDEGTPLLLHADSEHNGFSSGETDSPATAQNVPRAGYSSAPFPVETAEPHGHEHHIDRLKSARTADLLAIGLQTTLGISIHRVPEGLLLFAASHTDQQLGLSIVLALTIHSFSEGLSIAAPLYGALEDRNLVVLISALLGCGPQLVGAAIGATIFRGGRELSGSSRFIFGVSMALTSGFMSVVSIQMIASAYRYMSQTAVLYGVVAGIILSLLARAI